MKSTNAAESKAPVNNTTENATTVLEGSELGDIKIHENVVASLVRKAALAVDGVSRLAGNTLVDNIAEFVGSRRMQSRAIAIEMEENNRVSIELKLNLKFGFNIPEVAQKVQHAVIEGVEAVTGMTVLKVNVIVQEIEDPVPEETEENPENASTEMPLN